jgi:hypothetical protein
MSSVNPVLISEPTTNKLQQGQVIPEYHESLQVIEPAHNHSDHPDGPSVPQETNEQFDYDNNDLHELAPKSLIKEILPNAQELTQISSSEIGNNYGISVADRVSSRAQSEVPSRPQSQHSTCGKPMMRPIPTQDLHPQTVFESISQRGIHSSKVKKSGNAPHHPASAEVSTKAAISRQIHLRPRPSPNFFEDYKNFLANGQKMLEIMKDYEEQSQVVEAQKTEIEKLRDTSDFAINKVQALEIEKAALTGKLKKFTELSSKYKKHMNDVVKAQKYLKSQANEIQGRANKAIESAKQATETRAATEAALQKIETALKDAKSFRVPAENFACGE